MNTQPRILKWSLIIAIVIVLNLFFGYSMSLVFKAPDFTAYCPNDQVVTAPATQDACTSQGGQWIDNNSAYAKPLLPGVPALTGYCNTQFTCQNNFNTAQKTYERNVFITLLILGALLVLIGSFMKGNYVIAVGLSLAGLLSFIIASIRYWSFAGDYLHVGILALALVILFWVAYKKFRNNA